MVQYILLGSVIKTIFKSHCLKSPINTPVALSFTPALPTPFVLCIVCLMMVSVQSVFSFQKAEIKRNQREALCFQLFQRIRTHNFDQDKLVKPSLYLVIICRCNKMKPISNTGHAELEQLHSSGLVVFFRLSSTVILHSSSLTTKANNSFQASLKVLRL